MRTGSREWALSLVGPRQRARHICGHELVKLDTLAAFFCKHCRKTFGREVVEMGGLEMCAGPTDRSVSR